MTRTVQHKIIRDAVISKFLHEYQVLKVEISFRNSYFFSVSIPRDGSCTAVSVTHAGSAAPDFDLSEKCPSSETERAAYLLPGAYDIVLCVDFIETTG